MTTEDKQPTDITPTSPYVCRRALGEDDRDYFIRLLDEMEEAEQKAWDALSRYKFQMFGYWAAIWVHLNRIADTHQRSPFFEAVNLAKTKASDREERAKDYELARIWAGQQTKKRPAERGKES